MTDEKLKGLELLRSPFPANQISKLPKPTRDQAAEVKADNKVGVWCKLCNQWHHKNTIHLDYVGHAALTDRLLDCDPDWDWQPLSFDERGLPAFDNINGLWIKLTVCGKTRLGYGSADNKKGGNAVKEIIGDALRNAAMRFGAALDLWHKGELHVEDEGQPRQPFDETTVIKESIRAAGKGLPEYQKYFKSLCREAKEFLASHPKHETNKAEAGMVNDDPFGLPPQDEAINESPS